jgi:Fe-S cluster assembly protein SufD
LIYHHNPDSSDVIFYCCIKIEDGAEMTLLETTPGLRLNTVMEVDVADKAAFHH